MTTQSGPGVRRGQTQTFKLAWTANTGMSPARLLGPFPRATEVLVCVRVCVLPSLACVFVCVCLAGTASLCQGLWRDSDSPAESTKYHGNLRLIHFGVQVTLSLGQGFTLASK